MSRSNTVKFEGFSGAAQPAREVGKYRVLAELGRGGMANVYLAALRGKGAINKLVVLKALLPEIVSEPNSLAMFLDEARLAAQLNHGNVVQTYEVGTEGDRHVIVMEYLEGQSLAAVLRRAEKQGRTLPLALQLRVLIDVLEGLEYAHELKGYDGKPLQLVHRDISPQNVFITYDGRTKLLDFGIAKAATSTTHTATGVVKGKIAYMSPEQLSGEELDRRADVYAVGCMLWAAAAGQKLWKDTPDTKILRRVLEGDVPSPRSVNPNCDDELTRIVMKALATLRIDRYATARELQHELEHYCERIQAQSRARELASFVSELFADSRLELKTHIEQELALLSEFPGPTKSDATRALALPSSEAQTQKSSTQTISASTVNGSDGTPARKKTPWLVGVGVLGLALSAYALATRSPGDVTAPPSAARSAPPPAAELATKTSSVKIELRASPSDARLYLDGEPLAGNPALRVLPGDGKVHQLRAELAGYQTASAEFAAERDDAVELRLDALKAAPKPKSAATSRPSSHQEKKTAPTKPNCAQPFFVDTDGIKKVRPACL
ncbi:MAG TPA: serine/threonine-protein kinase [Polyangiaceae bacterium]|nr:serine/threonine-protein kinase [Polyangiaceae bacterium]